MTITRREGGEEYVTTGNYLKVERPSQTSATEAGWQQGFDLMAAAWSKSA